MTFDARGAPEREHIQAQQGDCAEKRKPDRASAPCLHMAWTLWLAKQREEVSTLGASAVASHEPQPSPSRATRTPNYQEMESRHNEALHTPRPQLCRAAKAGAVRVAQTALSDVSPTASRRTSPENPRLLHYERSRV